MILRALCRRVLQGAPPDLQYSGGWAGGKFEIRLRFQLRRDKSEIRELSSQPSPSGSMTAGGVSNSVGSSVSPKVSADADRACVSWTENGAVAAEILVRCSPLP